MLVARVIPSWRHCSVGLTVPDSRECRQAGCHLPPCPLLSPALHRPYVLTLSFRSAIYQEILCGYLIWAACRGFKSAHLWSCPPQRGDNFIFWVHPNYQVSRLLLAALIALTLPLQRNPSRDRLNAWYTTVFSRLKALGAVKSVDKFWGVYFQSVKVQRETRAAGIGGENGIGKPPAPVLLFVCGASLLGNIQMPSLGLGMLDNCLR